MKEITLIKREKIVFIDNPQNENTIWCIVYWVEYARNITITRIEYIKKTITDIDGVFLNIK